jgi:signal transduction histidine kinase
VKGGPQFKFYAGTPLTTKKGINIGSLCIMDVESRTGLSAHHGHVLGWLAGLVMTHLEISREAMEGKRAKLMSSGLNIFVDGRSRMKNSSGGYPGAESSQRNRQTRNHDSPKPSNRTSKGDEKLDGENAPRGSSAASRDRTSSDAEGDSEKRRHSTKERTTTSSEPSSDEEDFGTRHVEAVSDRHRSTFGRAANILRECFEMAGEDGVSFLEAGTGIIHTTTGLGPATSTPEETPTEGEAGQGQNDHPSSPMHQIGTSTSFDPLISAFTKHVKDPALVLACSTEQEPFLHGQCPGGRPALGDIDQDVIHELLNRYPQGKIWIMEDGGIIASSSEDDQGKKTTGSTSPPRLKKSPFRKAEASVIAKIFPGATQILFVPLWDAGIARWASCCIMWSTSQTRVFSTAIDLGFLSAFGKTIMAECSRLDTLVADKQKADFIGSISHELRSPLHGILAGAEFLAETATSAFQRSLIDTVEACGRTLLDTINHVLDFSKINSLDRNWRNNKQPRKRTVERHIGLGAQISAKNLPAGAPPLLRLYAITDIAAVTEEVVEGLSVGQIYSQATDLTDISAANRGRGGQKGVMVAPRTQGGREDGKQTAQDAIEVLLDIAKEDWVFMAQPGAIRRIIMNIFGKYVGALFSHPSCFQRVDISSSIKYTSSGTIKVQLGLTSIPGSAPDDARRTMVLTVSDTGKGIAAKFLSSRLFVPFAQVRRPDLSRTPGSGLLTAIRV